MRPVPRACPAQRGALRGVPHGLVVVPDGEVRRAVFLDDQVIHAWCLVPERDVLHITMSNAVIFLLFSSLQVWQFLFPPRRSTFSVDLGFLLFNAVTLVQYCTLTPSRSPTEPRSCDRSLLPSLLPRWRRYDVHPSPRAARRRGALRILVRSLRSSCRTEKACRLPLKDMLAADKDRLIASAKQTALQLRHKELDYFIERYSNLATQSSILAGFAFDSLVELEIHDNGHAKWVDSVFYTAGSCAMAFALYTLCVASFATVYGHRLALQGPTGSVERAVAIMMKHRTSIFVSFALAMISLITAATAMAWIKMGEAAAGVTGVFGLLFVLLVYKHQEMKYSFRIDPEHMVQGDVRLQVGIADVDVATLEAGFGGGGFSGDGGCGLQDPQASAAAAAFAAGSSAAHHHTVPLGRTLDGGAGVGIGSASAGTKAVERREPLLRGGTP